MAVDEILTRVWDQLLGRLNGPLSVRFIVQPVVAAMLAIRAGLHDAQLHRPPFLWTILTDPDERRLLLRSGWRDVGTVFALAVVLDSIYQIRVLRFYYPGETLIVACLMAFAPYVVLRGLATRMAETLRRRRVER